MGCDIYIYAEVRSKGVGDNALTCWQKVGDVFDSDLGKTDQPYKGRNYDLFGILADVRNGVGFAGCDTGDGFKPIDEQRGIPKDASPEIKSMSECVDWHSHSYLTLKELLDYDWFQKTVIRGWVNLEEFKTFIKKGEPDSWCGGVGGRQIDKDKMLELIKDRQDKGESEVEYYTQISWGKNYNECCQYFLENTIPALQKLADNPEDVRIVFWFDN